MRVRKMSLLIGKRVSFTTGSRTTRGGVVAPAICFTLRMSRAILSVTDTRHCDSRSGPSPVWSGAPPSHSPARAGWRLRAHQLTRTRPVGQPLYSLVIPQVGPYKPGHDAQPP